MIDLFDTHFFIRFAINMAAIFVLVKFCYFRFSQHRSYASSFILFGMAVFLVTGQLATVDISMGFAFGLFAIFSMLRYRTESIDVKEMTYLFLVISIALLAGVGTMSHIELLAIAAVIIGTAYITETNLLLPMLAEKSVEYEKIENIVPERQEELLADLQARLGLNIQKVEIKSVDFLRDTAKLKVQYLPTEEADK